MTQYTQWEICSIDVNGDIIDIAFYDKKAEAMLAFAGSTNSELYKVVHKQTAWEDTSREHTLIDSNGA